MFILLLIGIIIGVYIKETYQIPLMKPLMDKLFEMGNLREMESDTEENKEHQESEKKK
jgi:hypothetical protein|tara:strand:- start:738 stop:911 length:174 start_codon:yes stop_codon:yes gene_type:complete